MRRIMRSRPSPAIIVAVVALVAALAGTAVAGPGAESSVINRAKVKNISAKQANKAIDARLPVTSAELGTIAERSETFTIPNGQSDLRTVNCQPGEKVISGGGRFNTEPLAQTAFIQYDYRVGEGWRSGGANGSGANQQFTTYAYCLQP